MVQPEYGAMYCMAADSEAEAFTTMVCFHGAVFFELGDHVGYGGLLLADGDIDALNAGLGLVDDGVNRRWQILPIWRSPMISSRWPRPIGTMESMDFSPV